MWEIDDILRVKQFEDMIDEYGVTPSGELKVRHTYFTDSMRRMCGETFTIKSIVDNYNGEPRYYSREGIECRINGYAPWVIRDWMLEPQHGRISVSADEIMSLYE